MSAATAELENYHRSRSKQEVQNGEKVQEPGDGYQPVEMDRSYYSDVPQRALNFASWVHAITQGKKEVVDEIAKQDRYDQYHEYLVHTTRWTSSLLGSTSQ